MKRAILVCLCLLLLAPVLVAQCPAGFVKLDDKAAKLVFEPIAKTMFNAYHPQGHPVSQGEIDETIKQTRVSFLESWGVARSNSTLASRLGDLEGSRFNKETSSGGGAAGNSSVTSKGSVASLFSFAVDNGALTRSVSGTTLTFRTSPANVIKALSKGGWFEAGPSVPSYNDGSFESIAKRLSFFVSFDASRGNSGNGSGANNSSSTTAFTGDRQQLSGWGARYEIINHKDPRDARYTDDFRVLMRNHGKNLADTLQKDLSGVPEFDTVLGEITAQLQQSVAKHKDDEDAILQDYKTTDTQFLDKVCGLAESSPDTYRRVNDVVDSEVAFLVREADIFNKIAKDIKLSWTLSAEYNVTKQANTNGTLPASMSMISTSGGTLPDLGSINIVTSKGFSDGPELTANGSFTWFQGLPVGSRSGHIRDARVSAQFDVPLKEIKQIGKPTVSLSGLFLALFEQPLGQQVLVNDVPVSLTGNIGLVQGKLTIPTKSAISIPVSVTWASRTELIKESDIRGNIGITFDLDKLFAKGETKQ